ncbi:hypothetical protein HDU99_004998 [Rhizoclosmatium hyalinum]|nr:hypothetical protein HDU99_004998 [Rhizoclosmatium hyalinum]
MADETMEGAQAMPPPALSEHETLVYRLMLETEKANLQAAADSIIIDEAAINRLRAQLTADSSAQDVHIQVLQDREMLDRAMNLLAEPPVQVREFKSKIRRHPNGKPMNFRNQNKSKGELCTHYCNSSTIAAAIERRHPLLFRSSNSERLEFSDKPATIAFLTSYVRRCIQTSAVRGGSQTTAEDASVDQYNGILRKFEVFAEILGFGFDITQNPPHSIVIIAYINFQGLNPEDDDVQELKEQLLEMAKAAPGYNPAHLKFLEEEYFQVSGVVLNTLQRTVNVIRIFLGVCFHTGPYYVKDGVPHGNVLSDPLVKDVLAAVYRRVIGYKYTTLSAPKLDLLPDATKIALSHLDFTEERPNKLERVVGAGGFFTGIPIAARRGEIGPIQLDGLQLPINPTTNQIWIGDDGIPPFLRLILSETKGSGAFYVHLRRSNINLLDPVLYALAVKYLLEEHNTKLIQGNAEPQELIKYLFPKFLNSVPVGGEQGRISPTEESDRWASVQRRADLVQKGPDGEALIGKDGSTIPLYTTHSLRHSFVFWAALTMIWMSVATMAGGTLLSSLQTITPHVMFLEAIMKAGRWKTSSSFLRYLQEAGNHLKVVLAHLPPGTLHPLIQFWPWNDPLPNAITISQQGIGNQMLSVKQKRMVIAQAGQVVNDISAGSFFDGSMKGSIRVATDLEFKHYLGWLFKERYQDRWLDIFKNHDGTLGLPQQSPAPTAVHPPLQSQPQEQQPQQQQPHQSLQPQPPQQLPQLQPTHQPVQHNHSQSSSDDLNFCDDFLSDLLGSYTVGSENMELFTQPTVDQGDLSFLFSPSATAQQPMMELLFPTGTRKRFALVEAPSHAQPLSVTPLAPQIARPAQSTLPPQSILASTQSDQFSPLQLIPSNRMPQITSAPALTVQTATDCPFTLGKQSIQQVIATAASSEFQEWVKNFESNPQFFKGNRSTVSKTLNRFKSLAYVYATDFSSSADSWNYFFSCPQVNQSTLTDVAALKTRYDACHSAAPNQQSGCSPSVAEGKIGQLRKLRILSAAPCSDSRKRAKEND